MLLLILRGEKTNVEGYAVMDGLFRASVGALLLLKSPMTGVEDGVMLSALFMVKLLGGGGGDSNEGLNDGNGDDGGSGGGGGENADMSGLNDGCCNEDTLIDEED